MISLLAAWSLGLIFIIVPAGAAAPMKDDSPRPLLFISPSGSDTGRCTHSAPCASFDRAYALAGPRTIVRVAGGTYRAQTIQARSTRATPKVIFVPASRTPVRVTGALTVRGSHLELRGMTLTNVELPREADDVTFRNVRNFGFFMQGPSNISFIGGEVACGMCAFHPHLDDGGAPDHRPPRNILFDGVYFHDWHAASNDQHTECLQILAGDRITIRNSVFKNCATRHDGRGATADLHISWAGSGPKTRSIRVVNNFFYPSGNTYAIQAGDYANLDFRYNSIAGPILVGGGWGNGTPVEFVGNIMRLSSCQAPRTGTGPVARFVYRYNVLQGGTCGSTDIEGPSGFIDPVRNLHLKPRATAINRGDPNNYPKRDIDRDKRPKGGRPDAGADEAR